MPKRVREVLGLKEGDEAVTSVEDRVVIRKVRSPGEVLERLLGDLTFSRELRRAAEREAVKEVDA